MRQTAALCTWCCQVGAEPTTPALQTSIRKKLEDAKVERDRSQANEDIRSLRDEIAELRLAAPSGCS